MPHPAIDSAKAAALEGRRLVVEGAKKAKDWSAANPKQATAAGVGAAFVVAPMLIAAPVLGLLGFGANGIVGGSIAAGVQSGIGSVVAPSLFATLQSAAAGGCYSGSEPRLGGRVEGHDGTTTTPCAEDTDVGDDQSWGSLGAWLVRHYPGRRDVTARDCLLLDGRHELPQMLQSGDAWFFAGLTSSFPNLTESGADVLYEPQPCGSGETTPGCKVFGVPKSDAAQAQQIEGDEMTSHNGVALQDQVLVFQYKGKIHAVDNKCPHSSFPLAKGTPFDIEDFGVVLSAGITCPKHGWSFDLFTGRGDRNNYLLRTWEVQLRPMIEVGSDNNHGQNSDTQEVWIRRKQRMG
ncbi:hypothetical protein NUW58_g1358 [Xylaria curta]|uniref:Uncharacterized protein n=1 Tax=Xylaria curta TaxID=42375 RepID=A0ACC1PM68_9PEZI|nr:hypothetical protein NUW58_g1358 [Xylaria curta]